MIKNQRAWLEIDLDRIAWNVSQIKRLIPASAGIMAIVKADGYGHGAVECAKAAVSSGAAGLGVAIFEEGLNLRENSIKENILILGYTPEAKLTDVVKYGLSQTVFNKETAMELSRCALMQNTEARIHIKIDTGMGRIGFAPADSSVNTILEIAALPGIVIGGIYTHFADADNMDSDFSCEQYRRFADFINRLRAKGMKRTKCHICNSAGIIRFGQNPMDIVRPGIILYGLSPYKGAGVPNMELKAALSFKSRVANVKEMDKGMSVGYGRTFFTEKSTLVATVPVGYADGYMRNLSNKGRVIVNGEYAPVIGNICMDQFMIDVTEIKDVEIGAEVILIGECGDKAVCAGEIAERLNTINYEVVCAMGKRVPRYYTHGGF